MLCSDRSVHAPNLSELDPHKRPSRPDTERTVRGVARGPREAVLTASRDPEPINGGVQGGAMSPPGGVWGGAPEAAAIFHYCDLIPLPKMNNLGRSVAVF